MSGLCLSRRQRREQRTDEPGEVGLKVVVGLRRQEHRGPPGAYAVCAGEVVLQRGEGQPSGWIIDEAIEAFGGVCSVLEQIPQVVRVFVGAAAAEREGLEDDERSGAADPEGSGGLPAGERFTLDRDFLEVSERQV